MTGPARREGRERRVRHDALAGRRPGREIDAIRALLERDDLATEARRLVRSVAAAAPDLEPKDVGCVAHAIVRAALGSLRPSGG